MPEDEAAQTAHSPARRRPRKGPQNRPAQGLATALLLLLAIGILPALAATAWAVEHMRALALREAVAETDRLAAGTADRLRWLMQDAQATMAAVAQRPAVRALDTAACEALQRDFAGGSGASLMAMALRRLDGSAVCASPQAAASVADAPWFAVASAQDGFHATGAHALQPGQQWTTRLTYPVRDASGRRHALLVLPVDLLQLRQRLFERVPAGATAVVLDGDNRVLAQSAPHEQYDQYEQHQQPDRHDQPAGPAAAPAVAQALQGLRARRQAAPPDDRLQSLSQQYAEAGTDGSRSLFAVRTVPLTDWAVVTALPEDQTLQGYRAWLQRSAIAVLAVLLLGALAAWRVGRAILVPVRGLAAAARSMASRNDAALTPLAQAPVSGPQEIRELAQEFNRMARVSARSAEQLRASESRWRALIEQLPVAVLSYAAGGTLELANHSARALLGQPDDAVHGWHFADAAGQPLAAAAHPLQQALHTGQPVAAQPLGIVRESAPGRVATWVMVTAHPLTPGDGGLPRHVLLTLVDVTTQRAAEQDRVAREVAEAASRTKSAFLSRVSHELRTPLNAINGFSELLLSDHRLPGEARLKVDLVFNAGRHLLSLVEQIMDLTRVESGPLPLQLQPVQLWPLLQDCLAICQPLAQSRQVSLQWRAAALAAEGTGTASRADGSHDLRAVQVRGDEARLRQVLTNLVSNGIKYNRAGGQVRIDVQRLAGAAHGAPTLSINVCDTGVGLSAEHINGLFQPFERLGAEHRGIEGHGLGLVISRVLAQAMGGEIHVRSVLGEGACFALHLHAVAEDMAG